MAPYFQRMKLVSSSWLRPRTILDQTTTVTLVIPRVKNASAVLVRQPQSMSPVLWQPRWWGGCSGFKLHIVATSRGGACACCQDCSRLYCFVTSYSSCLAAAIVSALLPLACSACCHCMLTRSAAAVSIPISTGLLLLFCTTAHLACCHFQLAVNLIVSCHCTFFKYVLSHCFCYWLVIPVLSCYLHFILYQPAAGTYLQGQLVGCGWCGSAVHHITRTSLKKGF